MAEKFGKLTPTRLNPSDLEALLHRKSPLLALGSIGLGDEGAGILQRIGFSMPNVAAVNLEQNDLTSIGLRAICKFLAFCPNIERLVLDGNDFGEDPIGLEDLADFVSGFPRLTHVSLNGCGLSDVNLKQIQRLTRSVNLKTLDLRANKFERGIDSLRTPRPDLRVLISGQPFIPEKAKLPNMPLSGNGVMESFKPNLFLEELSTLIDQERRSFLAYEEKMHQKTKVQVESNESARTTLFALDACIAQLLASKEKIQAASIAAKNRSSRWASEQLLRSELLQRKLKLFQLKLKGTEQALAATKTRDVTQDLSEIQQEAKRTLERGDLEVSELRNATELLQHEIQIQREIALTKIKKHKSDPEERMVLTQLISLEKSQLNSELKRMKDDWENLVSLNGELKADLERKISEREIQIAKNRENLLSIEGFLSCEQTQLNDLCLERTDAETKLNQLKQEEENLKRDLLSIKRFINEKKATSISQLEVEKAKVESDIKAKTIELKNIESRIHLAREEIRELLLLREKNILQSVKRETTQIDFIHEVKKLLSP